MSLDQIKTNWESMEPSKRRKLVVGGAIAGFFVAVIGIGTIQELAGSSSDTRRQAGSSSSDTVRRELGTAPDVTGIDLFGADNAASERRRLREDLDVIAGSHRGFMDETREGFSSLNERLDGIGENLEQLDLNLARERTQRRAENEFLTQQMDELDGSTMQRFQQIGPHDSGSHQTLPQPMGVDPITGQARQPAAQQEPDVVEMSPFDMMAIAQHTGMDTSYVGQSYAEYQQQVTVSSAEQSSEASNGTAEHQSRGVQQPTRDVAGSNRDEGTAIDSDPEPEEHDRYAAGEITRIPAGSLMSAVMVSGLDAPVGMGGQDNPHPIIAKLTGRVKMPNNNFMDLRGCVVLASGYGDLSTEKVYLQTSTLSCISENNEIFETNVRSSALGQDGKVGLRGRVVTRDGALTARNMQAGLIQGLALAFQGGRQNFDVTTDRPYELPDSEFIGRTMIGEGVANSLDVMIDRYNRIMDQIFPVIEVDAGRQIEFQVLQGFDVRVM